EPLDRRRRSQAGLTLIELIVAFTILMLLSAMAVPLARYKVRREREVRLEYSLREIRSAIDKYNDAAYQGLLGTQKLDSDNYPEGSAQRVEWLVVSGAGCMTAKL